MSGEDGRHFMSAFEKKIDFGKMLPIHVSDIDIAKF